MAETCEMCRDALAHILAGLFKLSEDVASPATANEVAKHVILAQQIIENGEHEERRDD